jgi:UDP-hydrolysing UDP-N-acetyl-D-glucosamine 2-epimerase
LPIAGMRTIAIFTGNRAEYGNLHPVIRAIAVHEQLQYQLIVSGAHLSEDFGNTIAEIEADGIVVAERIDLGIGSSQQNDTTKDLSCCIERMGVIYKRKRPDIQLVLGDRYETFGAAVAAFFFGIPLAHIAGGDLSHGGCLDDSVRHAISKLAHIHFATNHDSAERLKKMGEEEWRVHNVGLPALDQILAEEFYDSTTLARELELDLSQPVILFTQHPVTLEATQAGKQVEESLKALVRLGIQTVITYPNTDPGNTLIRAEIEKYRSVRHFRIRKSLGRKRYLGLLRIASVMVGNSSSGLLEAPSFKLPVVNIGGRQRDRLRAENVIDVDCDAGQIEQAIRRALYDAEFREKVANCVNPYGDGRAAARIVRVLAEVELDDKLLRKRVNV